MNSIGFDKNEFPISTTVLGFMQSAAAMIEKLTSLVGGNYILSGCVVTGGSVSAGYVVVNGEIMLFSGGSLPTYVRVVATDELRTVQDATYIRTTKELVAGAGIGQILWSTFKNAEGILTKRQALITAYLGGVTSSWTGDVKYFRDLSGNVHVSIRNLVYTGESNLGYIGTSIFTLPVGYRPEVAYTKHVSGLLVQTEYIHKIGVGTSGLVSIQGIPNQVVPNVSINDYLIFRGA